MSVLDDNQPYSMFTNLPASLYVLRLCSLGLRDKSLTDLPYDAKLGISDLMEQVYIAGFDHIDSEKETEEAKVVKLRPEENKNRES